MAEPLVSIAIPTYNRAAGLRRAVASALAQDYPCMEVVISDNASTDETRAFCEELVRRDPRVRYVRQPVNVGPVGNFVHALEQCVGEYFMWLADDDWIDADYVRRCMEVLQRPGYSLVAGSTQYYRQGRWEFEAGSLDLEQDDPSERVLAYYRQVEENGVFYGLARRADRLANPFPRTIGGDWLAVARLAAAGKVATVRATSVHRAMEGVSDGMQSLVRAYKLRGRQARNPYGVIIRSIVADIVWGSPAFHALSMGRRVHLARRAAREVHARYYLRVQRHRSQLRRVKVVDRLREVPLARRVWHVVRPLLLRSRAS
jgi:glycosyltransferase involved in cell wall biosynthesis